MTALNLFLVINVIALIFWVMIIFAVVMILIELWKDMNNE